MLSIVVMLGNYFDSGGHKEWWVKSDTELTYKVDVTTFKAFQKVSGSWLGNSTKIGYEFVFSHTDSIINDLKQVIILIELDFDF